MRAICWLTQLCLSNAVQSNCAAANSGRNAVIETHALSGQQNMSDDDRDNSETVIIALALGTGCLVGAVCVVAFCVIKRLLAVRRRKRRAACQAPPRYAGRTGADSGDNDGGDDDNDTQKTAMASARASDVAGASERCLRGGEQRMPANDRAAGGRQPAVSSRPSDHSDRQRPAALDGSNRRQKAPAVLDGNTRRQKAPAAHNGARASGGDEHSAAKTVAVARTAPVGYSDLTTVRRNYRQQQQQQQQQQSSAGNNNEKQYGQRAVAPLGADGAHYESTVAAAIAAGATMESGGFTKHNLQW